MQMTLAEGDGKEEEKEEKKEDIIRYYGKKAHSNINDGVPLMLRTFKARGRRRKS